MLDRLVTGACALAALVVFTSSAHCATTGSVKMKGAKGKSTTSTMAQWIDRSTTPPKLIVPEGVMIEQDVSYLAPERKEKLDLYRPSTVEPGKRHPAIVMIHGGGWKGGDKTALREYSSGIAFAKAGYVAVSVEYKKDSDRWPTNVYDCKNAVRWLRKNADRLQVNPDRIGVIGGSAGGHLALMVAYTWEVPELEPKEPYPGISDSVSACVDMYGITNLLTRSQTDQDGTPNGKLKAPGVFDGRRGEDEDKWKLASPVFHVKKSSPPTMILHGTADTTVDRDQGKELAAKLRENGVECEYLSIEGAGHSFILTDPKLPKDLQPVVIKFFDRHLK